MSDSPIEIRDNGAVLEVTINRPKANAIDAATSREMGKVFGFLSVGMSLGASVAPLMFGLFMDYGRPDWIFLGAALFMMVTLLAAVAGRFVGVRSGLRRG